MRRFSTCALMLIALIITGCGAIPGNDQIDAGITKAKVTFCETDGKYTFCGAEIIDGKEKQSVVLDITHPSGVTVHYAASEVKAFDGQKIRAAVERAISADVRKAFPDIADKIINDLLGILVK